MYCLQINLTPTAAMTFRILPGSILNIATYPFVPPTTLSGYLRRVAMLIARLDIPETTINKDNPPFYTLPSNIVSLGAYPVTDTYTGVHRTYRKGMRSFNHDVFSRLYVEKDKANFQLHTWEYLIAEKLIGYVVSESKSDLEKFSHIKGMGCKLGKEGFAVVEKVSAPIELKRETISAKPSTIVPMEALLQSGEFINGCDIYNLYRYQWSSSQTNTDSFSNHSSAIDGFIPFVTGYYPPQSDSVATLEYYTNGEINIPTSLVNLIQGEVNV
ncbi:conserved hypothetical protein [Hyella patelloides LEGE 07179]|uniref:CRISPR-associated protein Cas5 n=1 Tax=Hyella patelloides LEGE 07179 TaxID=945734 RepID=A0A563VRK3_9CYAN|nr:hypothetical protein [Hyella patelloides]VEP14000.1 conserved hypothetical protein [Hyella patelloides LEGE 07179]